MDSTSGADSSTSAMWSELPATTPAATTTTLNTSISAPAGPSSFLTLPPELRLHIYDMALADYETVMIIRIHPLPHGGHNFWKTNDPLQAGPVFLFNKQCKRVIPSNLIGLLLTHPAVYSEFSSYMASPVYPKGVPSPIEIVFRIAQSDIMTDTSPGNFSMRAVGAESLHDTKRAIHEHWNHRLVSWAKHWVTCHPSVLHYSSLRSLSLNVEITAAEKTHYRLEIIGTMFQVDGLETCVRDLAMKAEKNIREWCPLVANNRRLGMVGRGALKGDVLGDRFFVDGKVKRLVSCFPGGEDMWEAKGSIRECRVKGRVDVVREGVVGWAFARPMDRIVGL